MTKEKKNRLLTIILLFVTAICIAVTIFLAIKYCQLRNEIENYTSQTSYLNNLLLSLAND